jgi:hypothetical protein
VSGTSIVTPPSVLMNSAKPSKLTITMWLMSIPRKFSTVLIVEAGLPLGLFVLQASEALIFWSPHSGIAAKLSRGIESLWNEVREVCRTMIVSARGGP